MARESALALEGVVGERGDCGAFASNFFCRTEGETVSMGGGLLGCVLLSLGSGVRDRGELLPPHCDIKLRTAERTYGQRCNNWNGRGLDKADACWQYHGTGAQQQRKQFHQRERPLTSIRSWHDCATIRPVWQLLFSLFWQPRTQPAVECGARAGRDSRSVTAGRSKVLYGMSFPSTLAFLLFGRAHFLKVRRRRMTRCQLNLA